MGCVLGDGAVAGELSHASKRIGRYRSCRNEAPGQAVPTIKPLVHIQYVGLLGKDLRSESAERRPGRFATESSKVTSVSIRTHFASSLIDPPPGLTIKAFAENRISAISIVPPFTNKVICRRYANHEPALSHRKDSGLAMRTSRQPRAKLGNAGMWAGGWAGQRRRAECRLISVLLAYSGG